MPASTRLVFNCIIFAALSLPGLVTFSQAADNTHADKPQGQKRMLMTKGEVFIIPECECLLLASDSILSVVAVLESSRRPEKYRAIDILKDDQVVMVNGKRVTKPDQFQALYDSLKLGDEIKIALKRAGKPMLVTFPKGEPIPGIKRKLSINDDDQPDGQDGGHRMIKSFGAGGEFDDLDVLAPLGILIGFTKGKGSVVDVMPMAGEVYGTELPQSNDEIVSIDGSPINGLDALETLRPKLTALKKGTLVVKRNGKELKFSYTVPEQLPNIMIKH